MKKIHQEEKILGEVLRSYRLLAKKTQEGLALEAGIDRTYISMLERGEASPTLKTLKSITKRLDVSLATLIQEFETKLQIAEDN